MTWEDEKTYYKCDFTQKYSLILLKVKIRAKFVCTIIIINHFNNSLGFVHKTRKVFKGRVFDKNHEISHRRGKDIVRYHV